MRTVTETRTFYNKIDCDALDHMTTKDVAAILRGIEGSYLPGRPTEYYKLCAGNAEEVEMDFDLLKICKAIDLAAAWLDKLPDA